MYQLDVKQLKRSYGGDTDEQGDGTDVSETI
jgi:hypothetical protein